MDEHLVPRARHCGSGWLGQPRIREPGGATRPADQGAAQQLSELTEREREIATAAAEGLTNSEIGARLYLSPATVKSHLSTIQMKLGVRNRVMVAVLVERAGWLQ